MYVCMYVCMYVYILCVYTCASANVYFNLRTNFIDVFIFLQKTLLTICNVIIRYLRLKEIELARKINFEFIKYFYY